MKSTDVGVVPLTEEKTRDIEKWLSDLKGGRVTLEKDDSSGIATITLNNADKRNAITGEMMVAMRHAVCDLESWNNGRGLIVTGAGSSFCAGFDMRYLEDTWKPGRPHDMSLYMHHVSTRVLQLPLLSVACIHGHAFGGGAEIIMACDFRLAHVDAKISFVQCKLGITTGFAGTTRLVNSVGRTNALMLLCGSPVITAQEACDMGLVHGVIANEGDFLGECKAWLSERCGKGPIATMRAVKQMVHYVDMHPVHESLTYERDTFTKFYGSPQNQEAVRKFLKKS